MIHNQETNCRMYVKGEVLGILKTKLQTYNCK